ncbi:MAG: hypothetical protein H6R10_13 [Rhodocyclaceae bacterium]|nr:hypothetical protein [Rhodocyclaceae bacterium]
MYVIPRLSPSDWLALAVFFISWAGYAWFSEQSRWSSKGLTGKSHEFRLEWAYRMLAREVRIVDSNLIGNLMGSVSFYANTTIYIIAGLLAALGALDKLINLSANLHLGGAGSRELIELKLLLLLGSFVYAYFKFTWSLRQFNLYSILVGAAPNGHRGEAEIDRYATRLASLNSLAGDDFNRGIRAYYFGLAALSWLVNPLLMAIFSISVLLILYHRDYRSPAQRVLST